MDGNRGMCYYIGIGGNMKGTREQIIAIRRRRRERTQVIIRTAKDKPCADCGQRYPYYVMDFDHGASEKCFNIGATGHTRNRPALHAEIAKCEVVCANCHRERTWGKPSP